MLADPCRIYDLDQADICCPEEFKQFHRKLNAALADIHFSIDHVIESGDEVAGIAIVQAKHRATGKPVSFKASFLSRVRDGRAVEAFKVTDFLSLFIQVGLLPADTVPSKPGTSRPPHTHHNPNKSEASTITEPGKTAQRLTIFPASF